jgi:Bacterial TniB protein
MTGIEHLHSSVVPYLSLADSDRIDFIKQNKWIGYDAAKKLIFKMEDLLNHPNSHRMPNMVIKSETNNGKSSILNRFLALHPAYEDLAENKMIVPVVNMEMPPNPKPDAIYNSLLRALRLPFRQSYSEDLKREMIKNGFNDFGVRMLTIDEFHVIINTVKLMKMQLLDTVKYLSNTLKVPIVVAGTKEAHTALLSDPQTANRFEPYLIPQWKLNDDFRKLLISFEKLIPLKKASNLSDVNLATKIYSETEGWIGEVHAYLAQAAIRAVENKNEQITLDLLKSMNWSGPSSRRIIS